MAAGFGAVLGLGDLADIIPSRSLARPPGAVREDQFVEDCIRCGACVKACPVRGIGLAHLSDGLRNVGTPMLDVPAGYCMVFKGLEKPNAETGAAWKKANEKGELCSDASKRAPRLPFNRLIATSSI